MHDVIDKDSAKLSQEQLLSEINRLRKEKNVVILAHYYQTPEIQDIADFVGDSLGLAQQAAKTTADMILFAGVVFMGETAKILCPTKKVIVPDMDAGCSLADNCPAPEFEKFIKAHPGHVVITYVNCSAAVKALTDIVCTSSNAVDIINSIPADQPIIFAPDQHLGRYLIQETGRDMVLWNGSCVVHETFDAQRIVKLKARHPNALIIAHPECPMSVLDLADFVGSTAKLISFAKDSPANEFIVVTESGILHQMQKACPGKILHSVPNEGSCTSCAECPFMRLNTLEKIYIALRDETPEITLPIELSEQARKPIERMLALS